MEDQRLQEELRLPPIRVCSGDCQVNPWAGSADVVTLTQGAAL